MAVPAWTAREWRPLAHDLYAHVVDKQPNAYAPAGALESSESYGYEGGKRLLLRADKVVAKLYSHRYMDITPQQISNEVQQLSDKMEIHLLPQRAERLRELAAGCDYRVVKMLIELAEAPTRASDNSVAVDHAVPQEAMEAWNRLLTPNKQAQREAQKARDDAALAARMEAELLQVAWGDDWWKDRGDTIRRESEPAAAPTSFSWSVPHVSWRRDTFFLFRLVRCTKLFIGDVLVAVVVPISLALRRLAVSYLSALTLRNVTQEVACTSSDLHFLRDLIVFLRTSPS